MTSKQRAYLKGLAMTLEPSFQLGKASLTPEYTEAIAEAFNRKELIKISVLKNCMDDPRWCRSLARKLYCIKKTRIIKRSNYQNKLYNLSI